MLPIDRIVKAIWESPTGRRVTTTAVSTAVSMLTKGAGHTGHGGGSTNNIGTVSNSHVR